MRGYQEKSKVLACVAGAYAIVGGLIGIFGYVLDIPRLTHWDSNGISIQPNASICATAAGLAVILVTLGFRRVAGFLGLAIATIGGLTFLEYITPLRLPIHDLLLFGREWGRVGVTVPGRMGPPASVSWTLIGIALFFASSPDSRRLQRWVPALAILTLIVSAVSITGYLYGASTLYGIPHLTVIAFQTATFILALSVALLAIVPQYGIVAVLLRQDPGGVLLRHMLVPVILIPLLIGWLHVQGQNMGWYDTAFGSALTALVTIVLLATMVTISARRVSQMSTAITEQGERHRVTLSSIGDAVIVTDACVNITMMNAVAEQLSGWRIADAIGRPVHNVFNIVHEKTREPAENPCDRAIRDGVTVGLANHTVLIARDGKEYPIDDSAAPIRDAAGKVIGCVLIFRDIAERNRAEGALRDREQRLSGILDSITDGFLTVDKDWRITFANDQIIERFGLPRQEVIGGNVWELFPQAIGNEAHVQMHRAMADRVPVDYEVFYPPWQKWFFDKIAPTPEGGLAVYSVDITQRKRNEQALRAAERSLQVALEIGRGASWDLDLLTGENYWSDSHFTLLGYQPTADRRATEAMWKGAIVPDDLPAVMSEWERALRERDAFRAEMRLCRADDGRIIWVRAAGQFLYDDSGKAVRMLGALFDVSEEKASERALRDSEQRVREIIRQMPAGVGVTDASGQWILTNPLMDRYVPGVIPPTLPDRIVRWRAWDEQGNPVPPDDWPGRRALRGEVVSPGVEMLYRKDDGQDVWMRVIASPLRDEQGAIIGAIAVVQDIDAVKRVEEKLRRSEAIHRKLSEANLFGVGFGDSRGNVFHVNDEMLRMMGRTRAEYEAGKINWVECIAPEHRARIKHEAQRVLEQGRSSGYEAEFVRPDGGRTPYLAAASLVEPGEDFHVSIALDLTQVREAEQRLRQQLTLTKSITDNASTALFIMDERQQCVFMNPEAERLTGYTLAETQGRPLHDVLHHTRPDGSPYPLSECPIDQAFPRNDRERGEETFVHKDGHFYPVAFTASPLRDEAGRPIGTVIEVRDITDRRQTEQALTRERERLDIALRTGSVGVYEWQAGSDRVWWSPEAYPLFGVDPATFSPTLDSFNALVHPDDRAELWRKSAESIERGEVFEHEYRIIRPDGEVRWIYNRSKVSSESGEKQITGVAADVTDRKRAEQAIRDSEARYRAVVESQTEMICRFKVSGEILFANAAYASAVGTTPDRMMDRTFWDFIPPDQHEYIRQMLAKLTPDSPEIRIENVFGTGSDRRWSLWNNRALSFDEHGNPVEAQSAGIDITDRRRAEEALRDADRRKDDFLATLAHELRNPLAPIRNSLEILKRAGDNRAIADNARRTMERQLAHVVRLVDDLLDVSRITHDKLTLRKERIELGPILHHALEACIPLSKERQHKIHANIPEQSIWVHADPARIIQVLDNLLTNACKYTPQGGMISLTVATDEREVMISVKDSGFGIAGNQLAKVFDPFTQVHTSLKESRSGLGIGLALVKRMVELHGGTVEAHSDGPGCGSEFIVRLPLET